MKEAGIPYKTEDGVADFHAAGRHTHITELLRSGVKLIEAKELARHSDVRMTMKYTHIGLDDQAKAVNQLTRDDVSRVRPRREVSALCLHGESSSCQCMASLDDGQRSIVQQWHGLPDAIKHAIRALCSTAD